MATAIPPRLFMIQVLIKGELQMSANYTEVVSSVKTAITEDGKLINKWEKAGENVAEFFQSAKAIEEVKAQFIADAILPALDKKHSEALGKDLPRKGSKEYIEHTQKDSGYADKWEIANQSKKDARATCDTYFKRVLKYAFPKPVSESSKKSFAEKITALIAEGGKIKECDFDLVKVMGFLVQAEKITKIKI
jgi:hypothetical protein